MGFLFFCLLVYVIAGGLWGFASKAEQRAAAAREIAAHPVRTAARVFWLTGTLLFGFGVLIPAIGKPIFPGTSMQCWAVGGLVALAGFVLSLIWRDF